MLFLVVVVFFFQAEDGIRDLVRSRGLGDVYKRQQVQGLRREGDFCAVALDDAADLQQHVLLDVVVLLSLIHI